MIPQNKYDILKKVVAVIDSCTTYDQLSIARRFASLFLRKLSREYDDLWHVAMKAIDEANNTKHNAIYNAEIAKLAKEMRSICLIHPPFTHGEFD